MKKKKILNCDFEVVARFVALLVVIVNAVLTMIGKNPLPFSQTEVYTAASAFFVLVTAVYAAWKNNSVSEEAKLGDKLMRAIKNGEITLKAAEDFLNSLSKGEKR